MSLPRLTSFLLLLAIATAASAQEYPGAQPGAGVFPQGFDQAVYKGVVGNVLDVIPMNPSKRLDLQRTNAVVGNALLGRTLTVLAGLSNPVLLIGGFVWGVWAASKIRLADSGIKPIADQKQSDIGSSAQKRLVELLEPSSAADEVPANRELVPTLASATPVETLDVAALSRSHVNKIWLPQHSPVLSQYR